MFCPECGNEVADSAKSCTKCGRSLVRMKHNSSGASGIVKILIVIMVLVLVAGATYAFLSGTRGDDGPGAFNPQGREWVPLNFKAHGIRLEVPGTGWNLHYDAESQVVLKDEIRGTIDINIVGAIALNPDSYRVDNKPDVYTILEQESIRLEGWGEEVLYTLVQGNEGGFIANKHQLYFRRTFLAPNGQDQTYTYLITFTCPSGLDSQYQPVFQHIIESIELYDYS